MAAALPRISARWLRRLHEALEYGQAAAQLDDQQDIPEWVMAEAENPTLGGAARADDATRHPQGPQGEDEEEGMPAMRLGVDRRDYRSDTLGSLAGEAPLDEDLALFDPALADDAPHTPHGAEQQGTVTLDELDLLTGAFHGTEAANAPQEQGVLEDAFDYASSAEETEAPIEYTANDP